MNRTALAPINAVLLVDGLGAEMPANTEVAASSALMVVTATIQQVVGRRGRGATVVRPQGCATKSVDIDTVRASSSRPSHL